MKKIFISSDHAGFKLKEEIKLYLSKKGISYDDMGPYNIDRVDYPDYAHKVAQHMPADGSVWITNNTKYHNAFNGGEEDRIHLVACVLDYKFN